MIDYKKEIAKKLLQINAINLNYEQSFIWASGIKSPIYCDNRITLSDIDTRNLICNGFINSSKNFNGFDVVAGVATGGIAHGMLLADRLGLPFIYIRTSAKGHGMKNAVEGRMEEGQRVLVIEDLISTGGSSFHAIQSILEAGGRIAGMMSIFTYGFEESILLFNKNGIQIESLTDYDTLLQCAIELGIIKNEQVAELMLWKQDPKGWRQ